MNVQAFARLPWFIRRKLKFSHSRKKLCQRHSCFQSRERRPETKVQSVPECQVRIGIAPAIELISIGELFRITVGRSHHRKNDLPGGNGLSLHFDFLSREPENPLQRRSKTQHLLDTGRQQFRPALQQSKLLRPFNEAKHGIVKKVRRGLAAGQ